MAIGNYQTLFQNYQQMVACPNLIDLDAFVLSQLPPDDTLAIESHLNTCPDCAALIQMLQTTPEIEDLHLNFEVPVNQPLAPHSQPLRERRVPAPGQIWSIPEFLPLPPALQKLSSSKFETGFLRLFVILAIGPCHLGRFQEICLCPLSEQIELATNQDIILMPHDSPFQEKQMLEIWNTQTVLAPCLDQDWGDISNQALDAAQAAFQGLEHQGLRGGKPAHPESAHLQFQALERSQLASLKAYMQVFQTFLQQSSQFMVQVTPRGLKSKAGSLNRPLIFPETQILNPDSVLAASTGLELEKNSNPVKERFIFENAIYLDVWLEAENLEFICLDQTQQAIQLTINYVSHDHAPKTVETDSWGTAFIPIQELAMGTQLFEFVLPGKDSYFYPFEIQ
jgi:hypothetical protein